MSAPRSDDTGKHWVWFAVILGLMSVAGFAVAVFSVLPLAMATDGCHTGDGEGVCRLSAAGQNLLVMIPWIGLIAGNAVAVLGAVVAARLGRSPLIGLLTGVVTYAAAIPIAYQVALRV